MKLSLGVIATAATVARAFVAPSNSLSRRFAVSHSPVWTPTKPSITRRLADEDLDEDEDEFGGEVGPLSRGIDSVSWLPSAVGSRGTVDETLKEKNSEIIPLVSADWWSLFQLFLRCRLSHYFSFSSLLAA